MEIRKTVSFSGSPDRALETARDTLVHQNFKLTATTRTSLEAEGPGMNSTKENPLLGLSRVRVDVTGHELSAVAEAGGVRRLLTIVSLVLVGVTIMDIALFSFLPNRNGSGPLHWYYGLAPTAPWIIIMPLMTRWVRRRTNRALDTLLANAAAIAATPAPNGPR